MSHASGDHGGGSGAGRGLARREFLFLGAVGVITPWLAGFTREAEAAVKQVPALAMSIGYVMGSDSFRTLRKLPWDPTSVRNAPGAAPQTLEIAAARDLPLGDQNLATETVWVTVHGLYPMGALQKQETLDAVDLDILYPAADPASTQPLPFHAWSFRRKPGQNFGQRVAVRVPLGLDGSLKLSLVVGNQGSLQRQPYEANFTVDAIQGRPKLQKGIYLLGLGPTMWNNTLTLPTTTGKPRVDLRSLVISIETRSPPKRAWLAKLPAGS